MEFFKQNKRIWAAACCALVGILFFFLLFDARILNPLETRWVQFGGGDNFQLISVGDFIAARLGSAI